MFGQQPGAKYGNVAVGGYASKREAKRGWELEQLEKAGKIRELRKQVRYELVPAQDGERAAYYVADFLYWDEEKGGYVVEDTKGVRTREYVLKRKLMLWRHGVRIFET